MNANNHIRKHYPYELIMRYARLLGFGDIHTKLDPKTGMNAIIAIHNIDLGPAIGGVRFLQYDAAGQAIIDSLRLAYMMTLKAAISGLAHGGAKSVIIAPSHLKDREHLFEHFGDFIHETNGRYIAACDVGTTTDDMDVIARRTPYVIGAAKTKNFETSPSIHTAKGVFLGMKAAVHHRFKQYSFDGLRVAIQGAGSVASHLTQLLVEAGAIVTACDPNADQLDQLKSLHNIKTVASDAIYDVPCDIFSPCALGNTINFNSIKQISATIIAGAANNQLSHPRIAKLLLDRGITYAPDFVINAGGLINAAMVYDYQDPGLADTKIDQLYNTLLTLFERSSRENTNTLKLAKTVALARLRQASVNNETQFTHPQQNQPLSEDFHE